MINGVGEAIDLESSEASNLGNSQTAVLFPAARGDADDEQAAAVGFVGVGAVEEFRLVAGSGEVTAWFASHGADGFLPGHEGPILGRDRGAHGGEQPDAHSS